MKILKTLLVSLLALTFSSCLEQGLEYLPEYEDADITSVSAVRYSYITDEKHPASNENIVKDVDLQYESDIDSDKNMVRIAASKPVNFPAEQEKNLSKSNLVVIVSISTAARLTPTEGSPKLGLPADWTKAHQIYYDCC